MYMGQYLKGNNKAQIKIHNSRYYAHAQISNAYNFCLNQNSAKFIRTFMGQYLKGNNMVQIKIHNSGYYAHAQTCKAYNFCLN